MPTHDEIAICARHIYEAEGRPQGKAMEHWLQAEARIAPDARHRERKAQAAGPAKNPRMAGPLAQAAARH